LNFIIILFHSEQLNFIHLLPIQIKKEFNTITTANRNIYGSNFSNNKEEKNHVIQEIIRMEYFFILLQIIFLMYQIKKTLKKYFC